MKNRIYWKERFSLLEQQQNLSLIHICVGMAGIENVSAKAAVIAEKDQTPAELVAGLTKLIAQYVLH